MADNITFHAQTIKRLASQEFVDYEDLKMIWMAADAIRITREREQEEAAFLAQCGPATHVGNEEVWEWKV